MFKASCKIIHFSVLLAWMLPCTSNRIWKRTIEADGLSDGGGRVEVGGTTALGDFFFFLDVDFSHYRVVMTMIVMQTATGIILTWEKGIFTVATFSEHIRILSKDSTVGTCFHTLSSQG